MEDFGDQIITIKIRGFVQTNTPIILLLAIAN